MFEYPWGILPRCRTFVRLRVAARISIPHYNRTTTAPQPHHNRTAIALQPHYNRMSSEIIRI